MKYFRILHSEHNKEYISRGIRFTFVMLYVNNRKS